MINQYKSILVQLSLNCRAEPQWMKFSSILRFWELIHCNQSPTQKRILFPACWLWEKKLLLHFPATAFLHRQIATHDSSMKSVLMKLPFALGLFNTGGQFSNSRKIPGVLDLSRNDAFLPGILHIRWQMVSWVRLHFAMCLPGSKPSHAQSGTCFWVNTSGLTFSLTAVGAVLGP